MSTSLHGIDQLFTQALEQQDYSLAAEILAHLRTPDRASYFTEQPLDSQLALADHLPDDRLCSIIKERPAEELEAFFEQLDTPRLQRLLNQLPSDDSARVLATFDENDQEQLLSPLPQADAIRHRLGYDEETAGAIMSSQFLSLPETVDIQAAQTMLATHESAQGPQLIFILDEEQRLKGSITALKLLQAKELSQAVAEIMDPDPLFVDEQSDQEYCSSIFLRYGQISIPVIDRHNRVIGCIHSEELTDIIQTEAAEDISHLGGTSSLPGSYLKANIIKMVAKRISWLILLFGAATLTTSIIASFQNQLEAVSLLAVFIPLITGTGGNAGSQTTTTIIRALAAGDVKIAQGLRIWFKEIRIGLLLGLAMAALAGGLTMMIYHQPAMAITLAVTLLSVVTAATGIASILPIVAQKFGLDPTLLSGPAISTIVDSMGLLIYFTIARIVFGI